jgi:hypothetical protein
VPPAAPNGRQRQRRQPHRRADNLVDDAIPGAEARFGDRRLRIGAGTVDHGVERAGAGGPARQGRHRIEVAELGDPSVEAAAERPHGLGRGVENGLVSSLPEDRETLARQPFGDTAADAAARPGDERPLCHDRPRHRPDGQDRPIGRCGQIIGRPVKPSVGSRKPAEPRAGAARR